MLEVRQAVPDRGAQHDGHDFCLERGRLLAVMGPSGVGKSTLLDAIAGFVPLRAGDIRLDGVSLLPLPPERRPVAMLFQDHNLFEHLPVADNLKLGFRQGRPTPVQWQRVMQACARLGVDGLLERMPSALSGGQRQRVALIRTVLREQPVVLLDEPFSALDADSTALAGEWVREEVRQGQRMLLFVTHAEQDAARWADDCLRLS
ncbi:MAG: ATP-binding cassette domain-containing protein [Rhodocyclaceae bacterium]